MNNNTLSIGQQLYIPTGQIVEDIVGTNYDTYIVLTGDTLYSISSKYGVNANELRNFNNLSGDTVFVGQQLLVPRSSNIVDNLITNYVDYRIKAGDTLYNISSRYGVSVDDLKKNK